MAEQLRTTCANLKQHDSSGNLATSLNLDDRRLLDLSSRVLQTAQELQDEVAKFSIRGQHSKQKALGKALKMLWRKGSISEIQARLEHYQRCLDTEILTNLRQRLHFISEDQNAGFKNVDAVVQRLVIAVAQGQQSLAGIRSLIIAGDSSTQQHISDEFERQRIRLAAEDYRKRLLESLYFPEIHTRQEEIKEAHKETFTWIFDDSGKNLRPWDNFTEWLRIGRGTYWINGKAGSGKSTLMGTICEDERTMKNLRVWSQARDPIITKIFFWNAGSEMQKSTVGLLRALLYQVVSALVDVVGCFRNIDGVSQPGSQQFPVWTEKRLSSYLFQVIEENSMSSPLCIFIDGLDEFAGDQDVLLSLVKMLSHCPGVKLCLSSRPYIRFEDELGSSAMLRLQDLTRTDVRSYAFARLNDVTPETSPTLHAPEWLRATVRDIESRAEGVFLWVELAVNDQVQGVYNGDDTETLRTRLDLFPSELKNVYTLMLQRIDKVYRREVGIYISMAIHIQNLMLRQVALATYDGLDELLDFFPDNQAVDVQQLCQQTSRRIAATCKGFMEVQVNTTHIPWSTVGFLHRTAADFLQESTIGKAYVNDAVESLTLAVKADLAGVILHDFADGVTEGRFRKDQDIVLVDRTEDILRNISQCEFNTGMAFVALTDQAHRVLSSPSCWYAPPPYADERLRPWRSILLRDTPMMYSDSPDTLETVCHKDNRSDVNLEFLVLAALHGLRLYVLHKLGSCTFLGNPETETYLLRSLLQILDLNFYRWWQIPQIELACALLKRGASAIVVWNKTDKKTGWTVFLAWLFKREYPMKNREHIEATNDLFLSLLRNGVDVNRRVLCNMIVFDKFPKNISKLYPHGRSSVQVDVVSINIYVSPLTILNDYLARIGDVFALRQGFTARGASELPASVDLNLGFEGNRSKTLKFHLSPEKSEHLLNTWKEHYVAEHSRDTFVPDSEDLLDDWYHEEGHALLQLHCADGTDSSDEWETEVSDSSDEASFHSANSKHSERLEA